MPFSSLEMPFSSLEIAGELSKKYAFDFINFEQSILIASYGYRGWYTRDGLCLAAVFGWHNHIGPCQDLTKIAERFIDYRDRHFHFYIKQKLDEIKWKVDALYPGSYRYSEEEGEAAGLGKFIEAETIMRAQEERLERLGREHPEKKYRFKFKRPDENLLYEMAKEFCPTLTEKFRMPYLVRPFRKQITNAIRGAYDNNIRQYYCQCAVRGLGEFNHAISLIVLGESISFWGTIRGSAAFFDPNFGLFLFKNIQEFFNFEREFFYRAYPKSRSVPLKVGTAVFCLKS